MMKIPPMKYGKVMRVASFALMASVTWMMITFAFGSQSPKPKPEPTPELKLVPPSDKKKRNPRLYLIMKRWMDIGISLLLIVLLLPLMAVVALVIVLDGKGSPILKLPRVGSRVRGKGGRFSWETKGITLYKFRTADATHEDFSTQPYMQVVHKDGETTGETKYAVQHNAKLSPVDFFLRRTRFDNLPLLFNVLKGDISLVGPRAASPEEVEAYNEKQLRRFEAPTGMTGWWQVTRNVTNGTSVSVNKMIEQDIWYVENKTLRRDLKILLLTPFVILMGRLYR